MIEVALIEAIVTALSGPGAAFVLLAGVLFFAWKLINRFIVIFSKHLESIEGKFDKLIEAVDKRLGRVEEHLDDVREDIAELRRRKDP